jgi:ectoine hydroxylase-related dioxygenase (phytanoyl-CoA dioxygenase family)
MSVDSVVDSFQRDGVAVVRGFYDPQRDIVPIQEGIRAVVELVARRHGIAVPTATAEEAMTIGYTRLIKANRAYGGEVYDAVKQVPSFLELVANRRNTELFRNLRAGSVPGIAAGGYGIRIDNPAEEKFRALWHQEFPAQLRSLDGVVFWSPLLPVSEAMGPVQICPGSHRDGLVPVFEDDQGIGKSGAYALTLDREAERIAAYKPIAPLTNPGDLVLMDFLTLHQSGRNGSDRPRWSMQWRLFNFADATGVKIGWAGSFAAGVKYSDVLPELVATKARS